MNNVPVQFSTASNLPISNSEVLTVNGLATTSLTLDYLDLAADETSFSVQATIVDPGTTTVLVLNDPDGTPDSGDEETAQKSLATEFFKEDYVLAQAELALYTQVSNFYLTSDLTEDFNEKMKQRIKVENLININIFFLLNKFLY